MIWLQKHYIKKLPLVLLLHNHIWFKTQPQSEIHETLTSWWLKSLREGIFFYVTSFWASMCTVYNVKCSSGYIHTTYNKAKLLVVTCVHGLAFLNTATVVGFTFHIKGNSPQLKNDVPLSLHMQKKKHRHIYKVSCNNVHLWSLITSEGCSIASPLWGLIVPKASLHWFYYLAKVAFKPV